MVNWFNGLERREQWLVLVGAGLVVFFILYSLLWQPAQNKQQLLETRYKASLSTLSWMQQNVAKYQSLSGNSGGRTGASMRLSQMVDQAAARSGLRVARFQPSGDNGAQVWMEKVEFNKVLAWLDQMENGYGVTIKTSAISQANTPGLVTVRVRLQKGA